MKEYLVEAIKEFPSPTGVNHYEFMDIKSPTDVYGAGFRPQQGLTIMNL